MTEWFRHAFTRETLSHPAAIRVVVPGDTFYVGMAACGTSESDPHWQIKKVVTTTGGDVTLAPPITTRTGKTGTLTTTVSIAPPSTVPDDTPHVTLSFRQNLNCDANDTTPTTPVEVKSENYANAIDPPYTIPLTEGDYEVNA